MAETTPTKRKRPVSLIIGIVIASPFIVLFVYMGTVSSRQSRTLTNELAWIMKNDLLLPAERPTRPQINVFCLDQCSSIGTTTSTKETNKNAHKLAVMFEVLAYQKGYTNSDIVCGEDTGQTHLLIPADEYCRLSATKNELMLSITIGAQTEWSPEEYKKRGGKPDVLPFYGLSIFITY